MQLIASFSIIYLQECKRALLDPLQAFQNISAESNCSTSEFLQILRADFSGKICLQECKLQIGNTGYCRLSKIYSVTSIKKFEIAFMI